MPSATMSTWPCQEVKAGHGRNGDQEERGDQGRSPHDSFPVSCGRPRNARRAARNEIGTNSIRPSAANHAGEWVIPYTSTARTTIVIPVTAKR